MFRTNETVHLDSFTPRKPSGTWYRLIHDSLESDAAKTTLSRSQIQFLLNRLKAEHLFSVPPPNAPIPGSPPR
ncbi:hypothetical protein ACTQ4E_07735 [Lawsonibacter sp. LCP25S3_G6]|uniref:hypothetical protein n=1 Tax=unclassified Lawsonibacter TaxID=2617946 RepID=UPI003F9533A9